MKNYHHDFPFDMMDVVAALGFPLERIRGSSTYFDCPFCGAPASRQKFCVDFQKNVYNCFHCPDPDQASGGMLKLYALVRFGRSGTEHIKKAAEDMREYKTGVRQNIAFRGTVQSARERADSNVTVQSTRTDEERSAVYTAFLAMLNLDDVHREQLRTRGLTDGQIERTGYKTVPLVRKEKYAQMLIDQGFQLEGIPGFFKKSNGKWSIYVQSSGFFVPFVTRNGLIPALQIRLDHSVKRKYVWFTSKGYLCGCTTHSYLHFIGDFTDGIIIITEGALKATVAYYLLQRLRELGAFSFDINISFIAVGGVTALCDLDCVIADLLRNHPFKIVLEAFDQDKFSNEKVANAMRRLWGKIETAIADIDHDVQLLSMPPDFFLDKGIDDHALIVLAEYLKTLNEASS